MVALPGEALLELITASTILPVLIYGATVALYLAVRRRLDRKEGAFDLGRFELPVAIVALIWLVVATVVLVTPAVRPSPDRYRLNARRRTVLRRHADVRPQVAGRRAKRCGRLHALSAGSRKPGRGV